MFYLWNLLGNFRVISCKCWLECSVLFGFLGFFSPRMQYGRTPLHLAASNGSLEVVRHLCLAGVNIDAVTNVSSRQLLFFYCLSVFLVMLQQRSSCPLCLSELHKYKFVLNEWNMRPALLWVFSKHVFLSLNKLIKILYAFLIEAEMSINTTWPPVTELHNLSGSGFKAWFSSFVFSFCYCNWVNLFSPDPCLEFPFF